MKRRSRMPAPATAPAPPREPLLTPAEAAEYLHVKPSTLKTWVQLKKIDSVRLNGKVRRFKRSALDRFIASHTEPADERR
jgi:excisionase family DNA binding protein